LVIQGIVVAVAGAGAGAGYSGAGAGAPAAAAADTGVFCLLNTLRSMDAAGCGCCAAVVIDRRPRPFLSAGTQHLSPHLLRSAHLRPVFDYSSCWLSAARTSAFF